MTTLESIWNAIVPYLTAGTLTGMLVAVITTGFKLIKWQKTTRMDAVNAINEKLMSLSVNKDVRLSLETLSRNELKKIEKTLADRLDKTLDTYSKEISEALNIIKTVASALAHFKAIPSEQVAELNAVLGLAAPATVIELKPIEIEPIKQIAAPTVPIEARDNPYDG